MKMADGDPILESGEMLHTEDGEVFTLTRDGHIISMMQEQPQETTEQMRALAGYDDMGGSPTTEHSGSAHPVGERWDEPILCSCDAYRKATGQMGSDPHCITHGYNA